MPKINAQLLQQRRLTLIALRPERSEPARPQPALLAHPAADGGAAEGRGRGAAADANAIPRVGGRGGGGGAVAAVGCLRGGRVPGNVAR
jgi:hypothetical protein